jgi:hypothetical protein
MTDTTTPATVQRWYNREERAWVVQLLDVEGYQIGEAIYVSSTNGGRAIAERAEQELRQQYGL